MIEISISRELADAHPGFMAGCAERGHAVEVFDSDRPAARSHETAGVETHLAGDSAGVPTAVERRAARTERPETRRPGASLRVFAGLRRPAPIQPRGGPLWPEASPTPGGVGRSNVPVNASAPELATSGADRILTRRTIDDGKP